MTADDSVVLHTAYTGSTSEVFGSSVVLNTYVTVDVNPNPNVTKVFDSIILEASDQIQSINATVENNSNRGNPAALTIPNTDITQVEGTYRAKKLRDAIDNRRLRGQYGTILVLFDTTTPTTTVLKSITTNYRESKRAI